jgi:hypothetical protein
MEKTSLIEYKLKSYLGGVLAKLKYVNSPLTPLTKVEYSFDGVTWTELSSQAFSNTIIAQDPVTPYIYTIERIFVPLAEYRDYLISFRLTNTVATGAQSIPGIGRRGGPPEALVVKPTLTRLPYMNRYTNVAFSVFSTLSSTVVGKMIVTFEYDPMLDGGSGSTPITDVLISLDSRQTWLQPDTLEVFKTTKQSNVVETYVAGDTNRTFSGIGTFVRVSYTLPQGGDFTYLQDSPIYYKTINFAGESPAIKIVTKLPLVIVTSPNNPDYPILNKIESSDWYFGSNQEVRRDLQVYLELPESTGFGEPYQLQSTQLLDLAELTPVSVTPPEGQQALKNIDLTVTTVGDTFRRGERLKIYSQANPSKIWFIAQVTSNSRVNPVLSLDILEKYAVTPYSISVNSFANGADEFHKNTPLWNIHNHPINYPLLDLYVGDQLRDDDVFVSGRTLSFFRKDISFNDIYFYATIISKDINIGKLTIKITSKSDCLQNNCHNNQSFLTSWEITPIMTSADTFPTEANDWVIEPLYPVLEARYNLAEASNPNSIIEKGTAGLTIIKDDNNIPTLGYFTIRGISDIETYALNMTYGPAGAEFLSRLSPTSTIQCSLLSIAQKVTFLPIRTYTEAVYTNEFVSWWYLSKLTPLVSQTEIKFKLPLAPNDNSTIAVAYRKIVRTEIENIEGITTPSSLYEGRVVGELNFVALQSTPTTDALREITFPIDEATHLNNEGRRVEISYEISFLKIIRNLTSNNEELLTELNKLKDKIPGDIVKTTISIPGAQPIDFVLGRELLNPTAIGLTLVYNDQLPGYEYLDFKDTQAQDITLKQTDFYRSTIEYSTNQGGSWRHVLKPGIPAYDEKFSQVNTTYYQNIGADIITFTEENYNVYPAGTLLSGETIQDYTYVVEALDAFSVRISKPQKASAFSPAVKSSVLAKYTGTSTTYTRFQKGTAIMYVDKYLDYTTDLPVKIANTTLTGAANIIAQRPYMLGNVKNYNQSTGRLEIVITSITTSPVSGALDNLSSWEITHALRKKTYIDKFISILYGYTNNYFSSASNTKRPTIYVGNLAEAQAYSIWLRTSNTLYGKGPIIKLSGTTTALPSSPPTVDVKLTIAGFDIDISPGFAEKAWIQAPQAAIQGYEYAIISGNVWYDVDVTPTWNTLNNGVITGLTQNAEYMLSFRSVSANGAGPATVPKVYKTASLPLKITSLTGFMPLIGITEIVLPSEIVLSAIPYTIEYELEQGYYDKLGRYIDDPTLAGKTGILADNSLLNLYTDLTATAIFNETQINSIRTYFVKLRCVNEVGQGPWSDTFILSVLSPEIRPVKVKWSPGPSCILIDEIGLMDTELKLNLTRGTRPAEIKTLNSAVRWQYAKVVTVAPRILTDNRIYYTGNEQKYTDAGQEEPVIHLKNALAAVEWQNIVSNTIPMEDEQSVILLFRAANAAGGIEMTDVLGYDGAYSRFTYNPIEPYGFASKYFQDGPEFDTYHRTKSIYQYDTDRPNRCYGALFKKTSFSANCPLPRLAYNKYGRYIKYQEELFSPFFNLEERTIKTQPFLDFELSYVKNYEQLGGINDTVYTSPMLTCTELPCELGVSSSVQVSAATEDILAPNDFVIITDSLTGGVAHRYALAYVKSVDEIDESNKTKSGYKIFWLNEETTAAALGSGFMSPWPEGLPTSVYNVVDSSSFRLHTLSELQPKFAKDPWTITSGYLPVSNTPGIIAAFKTTSNLFSGALPFRDADGKDFWSVTLNMSMTNYFENTYVGIKVYKYNNNPNQYATNTLTLLGESRFFRSEEPDINVFAQYNAVFFIPEEGIIFDIYDEIYLEIFACIKPNTLTHPPGTLSTQHTVTIKFDSSSYLSTTIPKDFKYRDQMVTFDVLRIGRLIPSNRAFYTPSAGARSYINKYAASVGFLIQGNVNWASLRQSLEQMLPVYRPYDLFPAQSPIAIEQGLVGDSWSQGNSYELVTLVPSRYYTDPLTPSIVNGSVFKVNGNTPAEYSLFSDGKLTSVPALKIITPISTAISDKYSVSEWLHGYLENNTFKGASTRTEKVYRATYVDQFNNVTEEGYDGIPTYKYAKDDVVIHYIDVYDTQNQHSRESVLYKSKVDNNDNPIYDTDYWEPITLPGVSKVDGQHPILPVPVITYSIQPPDPPIVVDIIEEHNRIGFVIKPPYFKKYKNNSTQIDDFLSANYYDGGMAKDSPLVFRANKSIGLTNHKSPEAQGISLESMLPTLRFKYPAAGISTVQFNRNNSSTLFAFDKYIVAGDNLYINAPGQLPALSKGYTIKSISTLQNGLCVIEYYDDFATADKSSFEFNFIFGGGHSVYVTHNPINDHVLVPDTTKSRYETNTYWLNNCLEDEEYLITIRLDNGWKPKLQKIENTYTKVYRVRTKKITPPAPAIDSIQYDGSVFKLNFTYGSSPVPLYYNWQELSANDYTELSTTVRQLPFYYGISFATVNETVLAGGEATITRTRYRTGSLAPIYKDYATNYWQQLLDMRQDITFSAYRWPTDAELQDIESQYSPAVWPTGKESYLNDRADKWFSRYKIPIDAYANKSTPGSVTDVKYYTPNASYPYDEQGVMALSTQTDIYSSNPMLLSPVGIKNDPRGRAYLTAYRRYWDDENYKIPSDAISSLSSNTDTFGERPTHIPIYSPTGKTLRDDNKVCGLLYTSDEYFNKHPYYQDYADSIYLSIYRAPFRRKAANNAVNNIHADIDSSGYSYSHINFPVRATLGSSKYTNNQQITLNSNGFYSVPSISSIPNSDTTYYSSSYVDTYFGIPAAINYFLTTNIEDYIPLYRETAVVRSNLSEDLLESQRVLAVVKYDNSPYTEIISTAFPGLAFNRRKDYEASEIDVPITDNLNLFSEIAANYYTDWFANDLYVPPKKKYSNFETFSAIEQEEFHAVSDFAVLKSYNRNIPTYAVYVCQSQNICCVMSSGNLNGISKNENDNPSDTFSSLLPFEHRPYISNQTPFVEWGFRRNYFQTLDYGYSKSFLDYDRYVWPVLSEGNIKDPNRTGAAPTYPASHMSPIELSGAYDASWSARNTIQLNKNISGDMVGENIKNLKMSQPTHVAIDGQGNIYISDTGNKKIKLLTRSETIKDPNLHESDIKNLINYTSARTISTLDEFPGQLEVSDDGNTITFLAGGKLYRRIKGVNYLITGENLNTTNKTPAKNYQWPVYSAAWGRSLPEDYGKEFISSFIQTTNGSTIFFSNGRGKVVKINCMTNLDKIAYVEYSFDNITFTKYSETTGIPVPNVQLGTAIPMYFRTVSTDNVRSTTVQLTTDPYLKANESVAVSSVTAALQFKATDYFTHKDGTTQRRARYLVTPPSIVTSLSEGENFPKNIITLVQSTRVTSVNNSAFVIAEAKQRLNYVQKIMRLKSTTAADLVKLKKEEELALKLIASPSLDVRTSDAWRFRNVSSAPISGISKYDFLEMDVTIKFTASRNTGITSINPTPIPYTDYIVIIKNITKNRVFEITGDATKYKYIKSKEIDPASGVITYVVRFYNDTYVTESNPRFKHWRTRPIFTDSEPPAYEYHRVPRQLKKFGNYTSPINLGQSYIRPADAALDRGWYSNEYVEFSGPDFSKGDTLEIYIVPDKTKYSKRASYTPYTITMSDATNLQLTGAKGQSVVY